MQKTPYKSCKKDHGIGKNVYDKKYDKKFLCILFEKFPPIIQKTQMTL